MTETLWLNGATLALVSGIIWVLFRTVARVRLDNSTGLTALRDHNTATAKDIYVQLTNFRVEVAKQYVTANHLRDVEDRIMNRLDSIERLVRNSVKK
ncbi:hypothetical protein LCGC14_2126310 [marine sediment metagenome]|uniref:Uncharacterized protein n=1 Tax=marine sediment metagenome TaxID=412755 RepID=A0A0F9EH93_9ZZZZ